MEQQYFKVRVPYEPYFYIAVREANFAEVETFLRCVLSSSIVIGCLTASLAVASTLPS